MKRPISLAHKTCTILFFINGWTWCLFVLLFVRSSSRFSWCSSVLYQYRCFYGWQSLFQTPSSPRASPNFVTSLFPFFLLGWGDDDQPQGMMPATAWTSQMLRNGCPTLEGRDWTMGYINGSTILTRWYTFIQVSKRLSVTVSSSQLAARVEHHVRTCILFSSVFFFWPFLFIALSGISGFKVRLLRDILTHFKKLEPNTLQKARAKKKRDTPVSNKRKSTDLGPGR